MNAGLLFRRAMAGRAARAVRLATALALVPLVALVHGVLVALLVLPVPQAQLLDAREPLVLLDRRGEQIAVVAGRGQAGAPWTPIAELPVIAASAVIESEDHGFWRHQGVDATGVLRALWLNVRGGKIGYGGSTLSMQVARMLISAGAPRTFGAKLRESFLALRLERSLSKHEILEQWLNRAYFGNGAVGLAAAAELYFGKPARALSTGEAVLLACLPRAPTGYDPLLRRDAAVRRRDYVLDLLARRGVLSESAAQAAKAQPLTIVKTPRLDRAPHFTRWILEQLSAAERRAGGTVVTTLDLRLQEVLARRVAQQVEELSRRNLQQAGLVALDAASGEVLAMVGSTGSREDPGSEVNIVTRKRHPGSALKPFVYAAAIERGASPASIAWDVRDAQDAYFSPHGGAEHGPVRFREALGSSYNFAAVDVLESVGISTVMSLLAKAGVAALPGTPEDYGLRLALGAAKVRLLDMTAGYRFLTYGGKVRAPRGVIELAPRGGVVRKPRVPPEVAVVSPATAWMVMDMLADPAARRPGFGTELPFDMPFRVAAKTGTARGFADTWAVAATEQVLVGAWAGTFDGTPTQGLVGMDAAAVLVRDALMTISQRTKLTLPRKPDGVELISVCPVSGLRPGPYCSHLADYAPAGKAPEATCDWHQHDGTVRYPARANGWLTRRRQE